MGLSWFQTEIVAEKKRQFSRTTTLDIIKDDVGASQSSRTSRFETSRPIPIDDVEKLTVDHEGSGQSFVIYKVAITLLRLLDVVY